MSAECAARTNSILDQHLELTNITGGTEGSCYRCTLPFSIVLLMIGTAVTAVAYSFNPHGSIISILGLVLLSSSLLLLLLGLAALRWKLRQGKKMDRHSASQCNLVESLRPN
ncbi:transmembrane protein 100-like [Neoarius graeffei]|uniref:transmembrane protein 100-like n=1 Tax=Neoarius graeffei TaxID=443677 RepID=UPI00298CE27E|nr:transmembrane protein 100-like [Neoarius graeffei]